MDVWDMTKLLARRWYLAVPFLLATAAVVLYLGLTIQPDYALTSHVLLSPPSTTSTPEQKSAVATNPWSALGTTALAQAGTLSIEGADVVKNLSDRSLSDSYVVTVDNWSPIITIEVVSDTEAKSVATTDALIAIFQTNVTQLQRSQGAVDSTLIRAQRLPGDKIETRNSNVKRVVVAVGAVGVLLACGLTIGLDALLRGRRSRPVSTRAAVLAPAAVAAEIPALAPARPSGVSLALPAPPNGQELPRQPQPAHLDPDLTVVMPLTLSRGDRRS